MKHKLTEADLEQLFVSSRFKRKNPTIIFLEFLAIFVAFFLIIYCLLNFSAIKQKIAFWYHDEFSTSDNRQISDAVNHLVDNNSTSSAQLPNLSDNTIFIESINIKAPITFGIANNENDVSNGLKNGVIQIFDTSLPGENGNVFITGHSSNYPWVSSSYNAIFALLNKMPVGDLVQIKFRDINYIYRVTEVFVTDPSNSDVMKSYSKKPTLTLMTCSPVGTNLKRLIVRSEQIYPDPKTNSANNTTGSPSKLPSIGK